MKNCSRDGVEMAAEFDELLTDAVSCISRELVTLTSHNPEQRQEPQVWKLTPAGNEGQLREVPSRACSLQNDGQSQRALHPQITGCKGCN